MAKLTQEQLVEMGSNLLDASRVLELRDLMAETIQILNKKGLQWEAQYTMNKYKNIENEVLQCVLKKIDDISCNLLNADNDEPYYDI